MREIVLHNKFEKEFKKHRNKLAFEDLKTLFYIIDKLQQDIILEQQYKDHQLKGTFQGYRECHVKPDLLLVFTKKENLLILARLNSHSELFD